jgi:hypothetical protein
MMIISSYKSTVSIPLGSCKLLHDLTTDDLQKLENPNSSSIPAVTEDLQKYDPNVVRCLQHSVLS